MATAARRVEIDLPHRRAGHCGSGALRDLLEFHGLSWTEEPLSEGMVFGLGAGLGFAYVELPAMDPPIYLVGRTAGLERDICEHLGIALDLRQTDDPQEGWRTLREALDAGRPTMVWADIQHLEYLRVRLQMTMHDIVVTGYDEGAGVAFIADNDRDEIQRCSLEALARARNSHAFPGPNRHATWLMDFPGDLPDPATAIHRALKRAIENMRGGGEGLTASAEGMGLPGVDTFAAGYPQWPERFGDNLDAALRGLRVFVVKAGTGGALFRGLHATFGHDAAALLGAVRPTHTNERHDADTLLDDIHSPATSEHSDDAPLDDIHSPATSEHSDDAPLDESRFASTSKRLAEVGDLYDRLAAEWVALAEAVMGDEAAAARHAKGAPRVKRIATLEHDGVEVMERALMALAEAG